MAARMSALAARRISQGKIFYVFTKWLGQGKLARVDGKPVMEARSQSRQPALHDGARRVHMSAFDILRPEEGRYAEAPKFGFTSFTQLRGVLVAFCGENLKFGLGGPKSAVAARRVVRRAAAADHFTGKSGVIARYCRSSRARCAAAGGDRNWQGRATSSVGISSSSVALRWAKCRQLPRRQQLLPNSDRARLKRPNCVIWCSGRGCEPIRSTSTRRRSKDDEDGQRSVEINFACSKPVAGAEKAWATAAAIADGVVIARDLVNEPANVLYPIEFARRTSALSKLGVDR